jgi:competence protein ComEC
VRLSLGLAFAAGITAPRSFACALAAIAAFVLLSGARRSSRALLLLPVWLALGAGALQLHQALDPAPPLLRDWRRLGFEERATPLLVEGRIVDLEDLPGDRLGITLSLSRWSLPGGSHPAPVARRPARLRATLPFQPGTPWPWAEGDRVRMSARVGRPRSYRNPAAFDYESYLEARGIQFTGTVKSPLLVERLERGAMWRRILPDLRRSAVASLKRAAGPGRDETAAFLAALLLGERQSLPQDLEEALQRSGVYHIIALSGFNVGLVVQLCSVLLACLPIGRRGRRLALLLAVLLYWGTARHGGSMARASLMVVIHLAGACLGRRIAPLGSLSLSGLLLMAWRPAWIADAGFQLSYAATLGLMSVLRWPSPGSASTSVFARGARRLVEDSIRASGAALLATAPLTAWHFHSLAPAALLGNLIAVPLSALSLVLALLIQATSCWAGTVAEMAAAASSCLLRILAGSARACASIPGGFLYVLPPPMPLLLALVPSVSLLMLAGSTRTRRLLAAATAGLLLLVVLAGRKPGTPGRLEVIAFDVGQGDAILCRFPNGLTVLCDAGGVLPGDFDLGARVVAPALRGLGLLRIDILAITHAHRDHLGGALSVLRQLRPQALWLGAMPRSDPRVEQLVAAAEKAGVSIVRPTRGVHLDLGGGRLDVLHPSSRDAPSMAARNDDSLVLRIAVGEHAVLLTGDAETGVEAQLAAGPWDLTADLLKVAHHGSRSSTSAGFLRRVAPHLALISVGPANPFHHPAPEVIARLLEAGACVLRTDRDGALVAATDGRHPWAASPLLQDDGMPSASEHPWCLGDEAEHEDDEADEGHDTPAPRQWSDVIQGTGMPGTEEREQHAEQHQMVASDKKTHGAQDQGAGPRRDRVNPRGQGIQHVAAVQLSYWQEIEGGREQSQPGGRERGVELDRHVRREAEEPGVQQLEDETGRQDNRPRLQRSAGGRGARQAVQEYGKRHDEPGDRSSDPDVEQGATVGEGGPDTDDGAECSEQIRSRKEERQGRFDAVIAAGHVVAHLVRAEDRQHAQGVRQPGHPGARVCEHPDEGLAGESVVPGHEGPGNEGGEEREGKAQDVDGGRQRATRTAGTSWAGRTGSLQRRRP